MEKKIKRQEIYNGLIMHVVKDDVMLDDGMIAPREIIYHRGGACIALKDHEGKYLLVKQYRYSQEKDMLEFTAGKLEEGEDPDITILREAVEETGYEAINVKKYGSIVPTCGYSSEVIYLYSGELGKFVGTHFDEAERIETFRYTLDEIEEMIKSGEIDDAKTIALVYRIKNDK